MGSFQSRPADELEDIDLGTQNVYRYPPKTGSFFGSHFIMGGEKFDTPQPEAFLFGDCMDLNFLGSKPTPFPYPAPHPNEPTKTLKALVNVRKESVHFVKIDPKVEERGATAAVTGEHAQENGVPNGGEAEANEPVEPKPKQKFNIEFVVDCDCRCAVTIHYLCTEEITAQGLTFTPRDPGKSSPTLKFKKGANQLFSVPSHIFDPNEWAEEDLGYSFDDEIMPIVLHCVAEEGEEPRQSHATIGIIERSSDGTFGLKAYKQKLFVDGLCYLLQEIYGIENKQSVTFENLGGSGETAKVPVVDGCTSDDEDTGAECIVCMCDPRDTLILPCRHLCLCNRCAESLRYQANNCPICRVPFRALLQIRAVQKESQEGREQAGAQEAGLPQYLTRGISLACWGYESVSLLEALNGWHRRSNPDAANQTASDAATSGKDAESEAPSGATARESTTHPPGRKPGDRTRSKDGGGRRSRKSNSTGGAPGDNRGKLRGAGKSHRSSSNAAGSSSTVEGAVGGGARGGDDDDEVDESKWMLSFSEIRAIVEDMRREEENGVRRKLAETLRESGRMETKPPLALAETTDEDDSAARAMGRSSSNTDPIQFIDGGAPDVVSVIDTTAEGATAVVTGDGLSNGEEKDDGEKADAESIPSSPTMSPPGSVQSGGSLKSSDCSVDSTKSLVTKKNKSALIPPSSSTAQHASVEVLRDGRYNIHVNNGGHQTSNV